MSRSDASLLCNLPSGVFATRVSVSACCDPACRNLSLPYMFNEVQTVSCGTAYRCMTQHSPLSL